MRCREHVEHDRDECRASPRAHRAVGRVLDERAEIVFEIAAELCQVGDDEAALDWLGTVVAAVGSDASMARVQVAEIHFEAGRTDLAMAALDAIKDSGERDPDAYALAGELLDDRGDERSALRWFTMGASRLREQELADARGELGWMSPGYGILWQRHLLRERLGYPPDDLQGTCGSPRVCGLASTTRPFRRRTRRSPTRAPTPRRHPGSSPGRNGTSRSRSSAGHICWQEATTHEQYRASGNAAA